MIAKCRNNNIKNLPADLKKYSWQQDSAGIMPLTIGNQYIVCGLQIAGTTELILILADDAKLSGQPWWHPRCLFEIVDNTEPNDWTGDINNSDWPIRSFPGIVNEATFNSNLQDGDGKEVKEFLAHYEKYAKYHNLTGVSKGDYRTVDEIQKQNKVKYEADLKLAKERGWEPPDKPTPQ